MVELLLLLLPVAAASGWYTARRGMASKTQKQPPQIAPVYFKGLNYLLNEQPDKAIDLFIELLDVDSDTVETHLALGNLFRRRGEVDRAIRIHQNLIARPSLNREQRAQALLELGQDYMRAGLFDRAENLFLELTELKLYNEQAYIYLLEIYQQEKEWQRCLDVAEKISESHYPSRPNAVAHFYCELAEQMLSQQNVIGCGGLSQTCPAGTAKQCAGVAITGRDRIYPGETADRWSNCYSRLRTTIPSILSEVLPRLVECYKKLGRQPELFEYLQQLYQRHHCTEAMMILSEMIVEKEGEGAGCGCLAQTSGRDT